MEANSRFRRPASRPGPLFALFLPILLAGCRDGGLGFEPELVAAQVAIRAAADDVARFGQTELEVGRGFILHAVVEARTFGGRTIYFTEAPALEIDGERVPGEALRPWSGPLRARVLWFTVEGSPPFAESGEIAFREIFQADWPLAWSVNGDLRPAVENYLPGRPGPPATARFGTQRFMVRVELLGRESDILPRRSLSSLGASALPASAEDFATVTVELPHPLGPLSRVFILPQREPTGPERQAVQRRIGEWLRRDLAFSRLTLLRRWVDELGLAWEDLAWEEVDLEGLSEWGEAGSPLRVGERVVWLLEDRGLEGKLDRDDLCLDYEQGARVLTLKEIFTGSGLVERARLGDRAAGGD